MTARLKILLLIDNLTTGGTQTNIVQLCRGIDREAFDVHIAYLGERGKPHETLTELGFPIAHFPRTGAFHVGPLRELVRFIRREGFDVVHCWLRTANFYGRMAGLLARQGKLLATHQNSRIALGGEVQGTPWRRRLSDTLHGTADRLLQPVTARMVTNAEAITEDLVAGGLDRGTMTVIYNGIDLTPYAHPLDRQEARRRLQLPEGRPITATVCRLVPRKNIRGLIEAAVALRDRGLDAVHLVVGDGYQRAELEAFARERAVSDRVTFLGERDDVPEILAAADVFVLPSGRGEGVPFAVVEAMATGIPAIGTSLGGTKEAILHEETGLIVPPDDPAAVAEAIHRITSDPALRDRLGAAARRRAHEAFSLQRMVQATEALYREITGTGE